VKYFTWRNFFYLLVLFAVLWYVFTHQADVEDVINQIKGQFF